MTPQIQQLIQQAGTDCSGKWMSMDHAEKFAQLIVRACVEQADLVQSQTIADGSLDYVNGRQMGIEVVKRRIQMIFGDNQ